MIPKPGQLEKSASGFATLNDFGIVYLEMQERTGKTLTSILMAERCPKVKKVLVLTKKSARDGWHETLEAYKHTKDYHVTNYHQANKLEAVYDLVILDEAHNYISSSPQPSQIWKKVKRLTWGNPIIYLSATPCAQGYHMLYHQFALSAWSPWRSYKTFYSWFRSYGIPNKIYTTTGQRETYTQVLDSVRGECEHLFIRGTRAELGFEHEPTDKLHYIDLSDGTKELYNTLVKHNIVEDYSDTGMDLVCDTPMKLRTSLHMLEGGVAKIQDKYFVLPNREKIDYILNTWGDTPDVAIFYNYKAELIKLTAIFKRARLLQSTSHAEGIDLKHIKHLIILSQDFSTARHTQRRARQANMARDTEIIVHFLLTEKGVSAQVYNTVSVNKTNYVDARFTKETL